MESTVLKRAGSIARVFVAGCVMSIAGCGGDGISIIPTEGTVTLDGKPLDKIMVEFWPESEGPRSFATTDDQGHFELTTDDGKRKGAAPGSHKVVLKDMSIYNDKFLGRAAENESNNSSGKKARISGKYSLPSTTTLVKVVEKGKDNNLTIEVEAK